LKNYLNIICSNLKLSAKLGSILFLLLIFTHPIFSQRKKSPIDEMKAAAEVHMKAGRYGEAIDLLNKYVAQRPQRYDGYHLRGLAYEQRTQYKNSVLDLQRAYKLARGTVKSKIKKDLDRVIKIWHTLLRKKIEGHLREIAIDPTNPFNYLEIGKSYRWLEEWGTAEEWYDKYLAMDDNASPDEIIRYTVILTHTKHIKKGEIILKKYVERYPNDWRLWSRYGYFTMWLSKYSIAKKAFENALSFKPFFKEAQDGLDIVTRKPYVTQYDPRSFEKEYPVDKYYRLLRKHPNSVDLRFKLVNQLIKADRMEEALQQLDIIGEDHSDDPRYQEKLQYVNDFRDKVYSKKIDYYTKKLEKDSTDKEAVSKLADYYSRLQNYDKAYSLLDNYFINVPGEKNSAMRFQYAKAAAWAREFDKSIQIMDGLLKESPNNLDYQLFRAQVSIWHNVDSDLAKQYLENVLAKRPDNADAHIALASLLVSEKDFEEAQKHADIAKKLSPKNHQNEVLQSRIDFEKMRAEEEKLYAILNEGREKVIAGDCEGALPFYEEYLSKAEPNDLITKEYGDALFCANQYDNALTTYEEVLANGFNYAAALNRGKVLYAMGDSLASIDAFRQLVKEEPDEFDPRLYLGDSYAKASFSDSARTIYDSLLTWDLDSTEIAMVNQRIGWLPLSGINAILATFPNYIGFAPSFTYYADNISFKYSNVGARLDFGITEFLTAGVSFYRHTLSANRNSLSDSLLNRQANTGVAFTGNRTFTTFKGNVTVSLSKRFRFGGGFGSLNSSDGLNETDNDFFMHYENKGVFSIAANYMNTDAAIVLYSPYLIDTRMNAKFWGFDGYYQHASGLKFTSHFDYISVTDGNEGNNFWVRLGKYFYDNLIAGYEYYYSNWAYDSPAYYSPINYESHSIWIDAELEKSKELNLNFGGKIGYITSSSFLLFDGFISGNYRPYSRLLITGRLSAGSTEQYNSSYKSFSASLSAYWTIY